MRNVYGWLNERLKIDQLLYFSKNKSVPVHHGTIWYYFGGISLFLFCIQLLTGLLLLFYYRVGPDASFESVQFIITKVKFGWLLRGIHAWSANLMILAVIIHLVSVFFHRSYRKPRELTWLTGMAMLFMAMGFGFSGYLLPWNELAFFATKVGTDSVGAIPLVGDFILDFLRGGTDVTGSTLSRFFGMHISLLPPLFTGVLAIHLIFVQTQGMSEPLESKKTAGKPKRSMPFLPDFALRDAIAWLIVLDIVIVLAVFFPWELGIKADAFTAAPAGIKPEWYFLAIFQTLKMLPAHIGPFEGELVGLTVIGMAVLVIFILPFIDRASSRGQRNRWLDWLGLIGLSYFAFFTILGYIVD